MPLFLCRCHHVSVYKLINSLSIYYAHKHFSSLNVRTHIAYSFKLGIELLYRIGNDGNQVLRWALTYASKCVFRHAIEKLQHFIVTLAKYMCRCCISTQSFNSILFTTRFKRKGIFRQIKNLIKKKQIMNEKKTF